jgi:hypothetical protein
MNKRTLAVIAFILALGLIGYWLIDGGRIYGVEQVQVEKVDELFGTVTTEWKDEPHVGLLPVIGPAAGVLLLLGIWLFATGGKRSGRVPGEPAKI